LKIRKSKPVTLDAARNRRIKLTVKQSKKQKTKMILFTIIFLVGSGAFIIRLLAGSRKLYYIEEAKMYIQTYSSFRYITVAFSGQRINRISEKSDYLKVLRGLDCCLLSLSIPSTNGFMQAPTLPEKFMKKITASTPFSAVLQTQENGGYPNCLTSESPLASGVQRKSV
jgi:hypothetical protein